MYVWVCAHVLAVFFEHRPTNCSLGSLFSPTPEISRYVREGVGFLSVALFLLRMMRGPLYPVGVRGWPFVLHSGIRQCRCHQYVGCGLCTISHTAFMFPLFPFRVSSYSIGFHPSAFVAPCVSHLLCCWRFFWPWHLTSGVCVCVCVCFMGRRPCTDHQGHAIVAAKNFQLCRLRDFPRFRPPHSFVESILSRSTQLALCRCCELHLCITFSFPTALHMACVHSEDPPTGHNFHLLLTLFVVLKALLHKAARKTTAVCGCTRTFGE